MGDVLDLGYLKYEAGRTPSLPPKTPRSHSPQPLITSLHTAKGDSSCRWKEGGESAELKVEMLLDYLGGPGVDREAGERGRRRGTSFDYEIMIRKMQAVGFDVGGRSHHPGKAGGLEELKRQRNRFFSRVSGRDTALPTPT